MYDELIKMLRTCSERDSCIGLEKACPYLRTGFCNNKAEKAADAIEELLASCDNFEAALKDSVKECEELRQIITHYEEESKGWWLAACNAKEERERLKEQIPKWIPVTERLPEDEVLCINDRQFYLVGLLYCDDVENYICETDGEIMYDVTHWMPLPQPPKDGEP